jgi:hypothetical protein
MSPRARRRRRVRRALKALRAGLSMIFPGVATTTVVR